jgi:hypothetical protein
MIPRSSLNLWDLIAYANFDIITYAADEEQGIRIISIYLLATVSLNVPQHRSSKKYRRDDANRPELGRLYLCWI